MVILRVLGVLHCIWFPCNIGFLALQELPGTRVQCASRETGRRAIQSRPRQSSPSLLLFLPPDRIRITRNLTRHFSRRRQKVTHSPPPIVGQSDSDGKAVRKPPERDETRLMMRTCVVSHHPFKYKCPIRVPEQETQFLVEGKQWLRDMLN